MSPAVASPTISTRRGALRFSMAALTAGIAAPALACTEPDQDAAMIGLCAQLMAVEDEIAALMVIRDTIEAEQRTEPQLLAMFDHRQQVFDQIHDQPAVTPLAGLLAMAYAAAASANRHFDGQIMCVEDSDWLAWSVVEFLVGAAA